MSIALCHFNQGSLCCAQDVRDARVYEGHVKDLSALMLNWDLCRLPSKISIIHRH